MRALLGLAVIVFNVAAVSQTDSFLCIADQSIGFVFDEVSKTWFPTTFDVGDRKYNVARSKDERHKWAVQRVGMNRPLMYCNDDFGGDDRMLACDATDPSFYLDVKTLRFTSAKVHGYILPSGKDYSEGDLAPYIEIGKCSPL